MQTLSQTFGAALLYIPTDDGTHLGDLQSTTFFPESKVKFKQEELYQQTGGLPDSYCSAAALYTRSSESRHLHCALVSPSYWHFGSWSEVEKQNPSLMLTFKVVVSSNSVRSKMELPTLALDPSSSTCLADVKLFTAGHLNLCRRKLVPAGTVWHCSSMPVEKSMGQHMCMHGLRRLYKHGESN